MAGSYGLGGAGLVGTGLGQKRSAMSGLSQAADLEAKRNMANEQAEAAEDAGEMQLAASAGAMAGMMTFGPVGAIIGGIGGALASSLF